MKKFARPIVCVSLILCLVALIGTTAVRAFDSIPEASPTPSPWILPPFPRPSPTFLPPPVPRPSPSVSPSASPTPPPNPSSSPLPQVCGITCQTDSQCFSASAVQYVCYNTQCRLASNPQAENCRESVTLGPTLPDAYVAYEPITFNDPQQTNKVLDKNMAAIDDGYGMGFQFSVTAGQNVETLAYEANLQELGSYIHSKVYGPDGKEISDGEADTRNVFTATQTGTYTLIVHTFGWKQGQALIQVFDPATNKIGMYGELDTPNHQTTKEFTETPGRDVFGRYFFQLIVWFPRDMYIQDDGTIRYFSKEAGTYVIVRPELTRASEGSYGDIESVPVNVWGENGSNYVHLSPQTTTWFDKGYTYNLAMQYVFADPNVGGTAASEQFASFSPLGVQSDLNNDQKIDLLDYSILSGEFLKSKEQYDADLNGDQRVDLLDYSIFVREYQEYQASLH